MALETGTYISALVSSNPPGTDGKSQGDDHLRLVKSTLGATFPNASRAFYFPDVPAAKTTTYTILPSDENALIFGDASAGDFTIFMPVGSSVFAGWKVSVMKSDSGANVVTVDGSSAETINGAATRTLKEQYALETYMWDGSEWKIFGIASEFAPGTLMLFQQTAAPTGWTKETTHNDKALRIVTGTPSNSGNDAFSTVFGVSKVATAHVLVESELPSHRHLMFAALTSTDVDLNNSQQVAEAFGIVSPEHYKMTKTATAATVGRSATAGSDGSHIHTLTMDLSYVDLILARKD